MTDMKKQDMKLQAIKLQDIKNISLLFFFYQSRNFSSIVENLM